MGATALNDLDMVHMWVSIHAPVWVRLANLPHIRLHYRFQFTHPCGCDASMPDAFYRAFGFNSRTRVGATYRQLAG